MNRVFIISDTHFGHKKILEFEAEARLFATIEEHDDELVRRWNQAVGPKDIVWHLGDVLFGQESFETLKRLNGVKKLVMGNHDQYPTIQYLEHFNAVFGAASITNKGNKGIMTHVPIHHEQFYRYQFNLHGHMHSNVIDDKRYINVSAEHTGLAPVLLDSVLDNWRARWL